MNASASLLAAAAAVTALLAPLAPPAEGAPAASAQANTAAAHVAAAPASPAAAAAAPLATALPNAPAAAPAAPPMTAADLDAFFAGLVPDEIQRADIAGMVVAVVKDGRPLYARGFGDADVAKRRAVTVDGTLFRVGSISKVFTWISVLQLVEQGRLDLDADVNRYLDFRLPAPFGRPVTLRHLMTHSAGFEESFKDLGAPDVATLETLHDYILSHVPHQIFAPGTMAAYSNFGATLAGYIVERVAAQPIAAYIDEHILRPLGMTHTTFVQPLPPALAPLMSAGYALGSGPPQDFELVTVAPAGSASTSAGDMTRFMLALLGDGQLGGATILRPETARLMRSRQFAMNDHVKGMCLGLYEETRNGHRIVGHGGDTLVFHSDMHLIHDAGVGFFLSYNSTGRADIGPRTPLFYQFLDRYFPFAPPQSPRIAAAIPSAAADARQVAGFYQSSRRPETTLLSLLALLGQSSVAAHPDGTITVDDIDRLNGQPRVFREVAPRLYQEIDGQGIIAAQDGPGGRLELTSPGAPIQVMQRVPFYAGKLLITIALCLSLLVTAGTLLLWPVAALVRRHYGHQLDASPQERRRRRGVRLACALQLLFFVLFLGTATYALQHLPALNRHLDPWWRLCQAIGWLGLAAIGFVLVDAGAVWAQSGRGWAKLRSLVLLVACAAYLHIVVLAHMLAWSLNY